jgi:type IV pilus modification protein PilV
MSTKKIFNNTVKKQSGFTLIEVMIALVILATGLLALMTMQIVSIKANAFSSEMTFSAMLAQQQLETLRNEGYAHTDLDAGHHAPTGTSEIPDGKGGKYAVTWDVVVDATTAMKTITLDVTWNSRRAGEDNTQTVLTRMRTVISQ